MTKHTKVSSVEFESWTTYHQPLGRQKRGHNEYCWVSKCGRWYARQGNFGTMILTDRERDVRHVVHGKMPEVEALVEEILKAEAR